MGYQLLSHLMSNILSYISEGRSSGSRAALAVAGGCRKEKLYRWVGGLFCWQ